MLTSIFRALFFSLVVFLAAPQTSSATSCHPQRYYEHIRFAEWVFVGKVIEAILLDPEGNSIEFVVTEIDRLRGDPPDLVELKTSRGAYNPKITIGEKYIVFVNSDNRNVGYCSGFKMYAPTEYLDVLLMRQRGDCGTDYDREVAVLISRQQFFEEDMPYTRQMVEDLLKHYHSISPSLDIRYQEGRISVKGVEFMFVDDVLSGIDLGKCDA